MNLVESSYLLSPGHAEAWCPEVRGKSTGFVFRAEGKRQEKASHRSESLRVSPATPEVWLILDLGFYNNVEH